MEGEEVKEGRKDNRPAHRFCRTCTHAIFQLSKGAKGTPPCSVPASGASPQSCRTCSPRPNPPICFCLACSSPDVSVIPSTLHSHSGRPFRALQGFPIYRAPPRPGSRPTSCSVCLHSTHDYRYLYQFVCKSHEGRDFCLSYSSLLPQYLVQCLAHGRDEEIFKSNYWINKGDKHRSLCTGFGTITSNQLCG